jgi:thioesterase DpgC
MQNATPPAAIDVLTDALPENAVQEWLADEPTETNDLISDRERYRTFWQGAQRLIDMMPEKSARPAAQEQAAEAIWARTRESRDRFLRAHARAVYGALTHRMAGFVRVEALLYAAADAFPGLVPTRAQIAAEKDLLQRDKDGLEIDQGILVSHILAHDQVGRHLCHAMLLPRPEAEDALAKLASDGALDLGAVRLERHDRAIHLIMSNPRFLNAEDQTTIDAMEIGVDVAILDPESHIAVLRGAPAEHPKYAGRRIFGSGINLTHLYRGRIPFVWFLQRELGFVHKFLRGVARP